MNGLSLPQKPSWVAKIDVEGFELKALKGMEPALKAKAFKGLCVELNAYTLGFCGSTPEELISFLNACVYRLHETREANGFFIPQS